MMIACITSRPTAASRIARYAGLLTNPRDTINVVAPAGGCGTFRRIMSAAQVQVTELNPDATQARLREVFGDCWSSSKIHLRTHERLLRGIEAAKSLSGGDCVHRCELGARAGSCAGPSGF